MHSEQQVRFERERENLLSLRGDVRDIPMSELKMSELQRCFLGWRVASTTMPLLGSESLHFYA